MAAGLPLRTAVAARQRASVRPYDRQLQMRRRCCSTKRKPATFGEILVRSGPCLADGTCARPVRWPSRWAFSGSTCNELCNNRRRVTAVTALILARVFGNSPDFWLNVQRRSDLWEAANSPRQRERIGRPAFIWAINPSGSSGEITMRRGHPARLRISTHWPAIPPLLAIAAAGLEQEPIRLHDPVNAFDVDRRPAVFSRPSARRSCR